MVSMTPKRLNFYDHTLKSLRAFFQEKGEKPFRSDQVFTWVYRKRIEELKDMTDLSLSVRKTLPDWMCFDRPKVVDFRTSVDGTEKYLFYAGDGLTMETVMIPADNRKTLCVSSEVGCNLGCTFCYTGRFKLKKRLSAGEIVGQFLEVDNEHKARGENGLSNVVFMGMGEPLDNIEGVFGAIDILTHDKGINFSKKRITVSTSGLIKHMPKVTEAGVHLAVSLNGSNDEIRSEVMPINKHYPIKELLEATDKHSEKTGLEVTFEYVMLKDKTDKMEHARELVSLLKGRKAMVNLIPFNEHPGSDFKKPEEKQIVAFQKYLISKGQRAYRRRTRGTDIYAACGQLHAVKSKQSSDLYARKKSQGILA